MNKIGILTYHYSVNYGAVLQSYALQKFLRSQGYSVECIDYRPSQIRDSNLKYLYFKGNKLINPLLLYSGTKKGIKLKHFINSEISLSSKTIYDKKDLSFIVSQYDAVICGSDEVWNINDSHTKFGKDLSYFLDFIKIKDTKKLSYATSFGYTKELKNLRTQLCSLLQDFDGIGVRDSNSLRLVEECGRKGQKVLDPTFLVDYSDILQPPNVNSKYILLYGSFSKEQGHYIETVAKAEGLKIISIGARPGKWKPPTNFLSVSPKEWLGYFSNATYIFTNYFHGAIFAIIFRKPFSSFDRPGKSIKVKDLLGSLSLEDRIVAPQQIPFLSHKLSFTMNWNEEKLEQMIAESKNYLLKNLEVNFNKLASYNEDR